MSKEDGKTIGAGKPKISRREFLRTSALAAAGVMAAACSKKEKPGGLPTATPEKPAETPAKASTAAPVVKETVVVKETPEKPGDDGLPPSPTTRVTLAPEVEPGATPTAIAHDITGEMKEDYKKRNPDQEEAFSVNVGVFDIWPSGMNKKVKDFLPLGANPQNISFEDLAGKTRVLVDPHSENARVIAIPWEPEEGEPEILAFFTPLLARSLINGEVEREIDYLVSQGEGDEAEYLHLAVYRNQEEKGEEEGKGRIEEIVVPFVTKETVGVEKWGQIMNLYAEKQVVGIATGIETKETIEKDGTRREEDVMVMILFDDDGKELLRVDLAGHELSETQRKEATEEGVGAVASLDVGGGRYDLGEEIIKLWEIPKPEVPEIEGLRAEWEKDKMVYRAEAGNPYGLEAGVFAGFFYPEAYFLDVDPKSKIETEDQVGALAFRSEVLEVLLKEAGYPNKIVFPIPFDISYNQNPNERVVIWQTVGTNYGAPLFFHLPKDSKVIASLPNKDISMSAEVRLRISPQSWERAAVDFDPGGTFTGDYQGYVFYVNFSNSKLKKGEEITLNLGDSLPESDLKATFLPTFFEYIKQFFSLPETLKEPGQRLNVQFAAQTFVESPDKPMEYADLSRENLLRVGNSPVSSIANDNPLLES